MALGFTATDQAVIRLHGDSRFEVYDARIQILTLTTQLDRY